MKFINGTNKEELEDFELRKNISINAPHSFNFIQCYFHTIYGIHQIAFYLFKDDNNNDAF